METLYCQLRHNECKQNSGWILPVGVSSICMSLDSMQLDWVHIRQHSNAVYVRRDGDGCLYIYIYRKIMGNRHYSSTEWQLCEFKEKVCTMQKTMIPALPAKMHQHKDKPITIPAICRFLLQILFWQILQISTWKQGKWHIWACVRYWPVFRGWIGRVVCCCPLHTALRIEIMTSNLIFA